VEVFLAEKHRPDAGHAVTGHRRQRPVSVGWRGAERQRASSSTGRRAAAHLHVQSLVEGRLTLQTGRGMFTVHRPVLMTWRESRERAS
jgi:hypothetical protein